MLNVFFGASFDLIKIRDTVVIVISAIPPMICDGFIYVLIILLFIYLPYVIPVKYIFSADRA